MRVEPICQPVRCSLLHFIRIKELPQTKARRPNTAQLVKFCFAISDAKMQKFAFENQFENLSFSKIGEVTSASVLKINADEIAVNELVHAFNHPDESQVSTLWLSTDET